VSGGDATRIVDGPRSLGGERRYLEMKSRGWSKMDRDVA